MKVLTDTHTLVWALSDPAALGAGAHAALAGLPFTASVVNLWELVVKSRNPARWLPIRSPGGNTLSDHGLRRSPSAPRISAGWRDCPSFTRTPLIAILVAQALAEGLTLATKDAVLARYGASFVWQ